MRQSNAVRGHGALIGESGAAIALMAAIAILLISVSVGSAQTARPGSTDVERIPPIDLFIYADQSDSVFTSVDGMRPADQLAQMIEDAIDSPLGDGVTRRVLSGEGRLFLYGFGEDAPLSEQAGDCGDDVVTLVDGLTGADRSQIDSAIASYASENPEKKATNFECLFQHIAENEALQRAVSQDRQAMVLIASDFLHDPFNKSTIPNSGQWNPALIRRGVFREGQGICEFEGLYRNGALPPQVEAALTAAAATGRESRYPPLYGLLEFDLTTDNFRTDPDGPYATCALDTSRNGLFAGLIEDPLNASRFRFEDAANFGPQFVSRMVTRIASPPDLNEISLKPLSENSVELVATVSNPASVPVTVLRGFVSNGTDTEDFVPSEGGITLPPGGDGTIGPVVVDGDGFGTEDSLSISFEYRVGDTERTSLTKGSPRSLEVGDALSIMADEPLAPPNQPARVGVSLRNSAAQTLTLDRLAVGVSLPGVDVDLPEDNRQIPTGGTVRFPVTIPQRLMGALLQGNLQIFAEASLPGRVGREPLRASTEISAPATTVPLMVSKAVLHFRNGLDRNPDLELNVSNDNNFDSEVARLDFQTVSGRRLGTFELTEAGQGAVAAENQRLVEISATQLREGEVYGPILQALRRREDVRVVAVGNDLGQVSPDQQASIDVVYDEPPQIVCPSESRNESFTWSQPRGSAGFLELRLSYTSDASLLPAINGFAVSNGTDEVRKEDDWGPFEWEPTRDGGRTQSRVVIAFDDPDMRKLRYETTHNLDIELFDANRNSICGEFQIPAHAGGDPQPIQIDEDSWHLRQDTGSGDLFLEFEVFHESLTTDQRLDEVRILEAGSADSDEGSIYPETSMLQTPERIAEGRAYISPGRSKAQIVRMNLRRLGLEPQDVTGQRLRVRSWHDIQQGIFGKVYTVKIDRPSVTLTNFSWAAEESVLSMDATPNAISKIGEFLIAPGIVGIGGKLAADRSNVATFPFQEGEILMPEDRQRTLNAELSAEAQDAWKGILSADSLFGCAGIAGQEPSECENWVALPRMPPSQFQVITSPGLGANGIGYDALDQRLKAQVTNFGPYIDVIRGARFSETGSNVVVEETFETEDHVVVPPGRSMHLAALISSERQSFLLEAVVFDYRLVTRQGSSMPLETGRADPPQLTFRDVETHQIDFVAKNTYFFLADFFSDKTISIPPPTLSSNVRIERQLGEIQPVILSIGLTGNGQNLTSGQLKIVTVSGPSDPDNSTIADRRLGMQVRDVLIEDNSVTLLGELRLPGADSGLTELSSDKFDAETSSNPPVYRAFIYTSFVISLLFLMVLLLVQESFLKKSYTRALALYLGGGMLLLISSFFAFVFNRQLAVPPEVFNFVSQLVVNTIAPVGGAAAGGAALLMTNRWSSKWLLSQLTGLSKEQIAVTPHEELAWIVYRWVRGVSLVLVILSIVSMFWLEGQMFTAPDICHPQYDIQIPAKGAC